MPIRHEVPIGDVTPRQAAQHMGLSLRRFNRVLPELLGRDFPQADPITGNFDLDAICRWRRERYPHVYGDELTEAQSARDATARISEKIARFAGG